MYTGEKNYNSTKHRARILFFHFTILNIKAV